MWVKECCRCFFVILSLMRTPGAGNPRTSAEKLAGEAAPAVSTTDGGGAEEGARGAFLQPAPGRQERSGEEACLFSGNELFSHVFEGGRDVLSKKAFFY